MHASREAVVKVVRANADTRLELLPQESDTFGAWLLSSVAVSRVPLLRVDSLSARADAKRRVGVWLALECLQRTGSFKVRGALLAIGKAKERGEKAIVAASAGNHGAGVAYAARECRIEATIVVPSTAPKKKIDNIRSFGARIVQHGDGYDAAEAHAIALAKERGVAFISPYDDIDVIAGNGGSLAWEIVDGLKHAIAQRPLVPNIVLAPFGGGGLATGLACGLAHALGNANRRVWGVQAEASPAVAMSLERGSAVTSLPYKETVADGLEGGIPERAFARAAGVVAGAIVVSEEQIIEAMRFAFHELGLVVEGSAAAALAPVLAGLPPEVLPADMTGDIVVVLTGRNVDRERLARLVW
jgi:threonine dehydratase